MAKTTAEYLTSIADSKEAIRQAIVSKEQSCDKTVPFSQYAGKIMAITAGTEIVYQSSAEFYQCVFCADGVWSGYKAVLENGRYHFETTITEGLKYTSVKPEVGKIYTIDALAQIAYLYDITGTAGQCPNLPECVTATCTSCNEKYCKTHDTHTCENGGGGDDDDKCPNLPNCNVVGCVDCGKEYCETHVNHECNEEPNPEPEPEPNPNEKPANCPDGDGCSKNTCVNCGHVYCKTHDKECVCGWGQECPRTKFCILTACGCGASYCRTHEEHPADKCCQNNPNCNYVTCSLCDASYCKKHDTHEKCSECVVDGCTYLGEYSCRKCGDKFCSDHNNTHLETCECSGRYCEDCIDNHTHVSMGVCSVLGCMATSYAKECNTCHKKYCAEHAPGHGTMCNICNKWQCDACYSSHNCVADCSFEACSRVASGTCQECNKKYCSEHMTVCAISSCKKPICYLCIDSNGYCKEHSQSICNAKDCNNGNLTKCAACGFSYCKAVHTTTCSHEGCGKTYCLACYNGHLSTHEIECDVVGCSNTLKEECPQCNMKLCNEHLAEHNCESSSSTKTCGYNGCTSTELYSGRVCHICDKKYCIEHAASIIACNACKEYTCSQHLDSSGLCVNC